MCTINNAKKTHKVTQTNDKLKVVKILNCIS